MDHEFFLSGATPKFNLHLPFSEETLNRFCEQTDFLGTMKLFRAFEEDDHSKTAQDTINRMNSHRISLLLEAGSEMQSKAISFKHCPLIWDTGASYGLTPFRGDFIDYEECNIPVQDISILVSRYCWQE